MKRILVFLLVLFVITKLYSQFDFRPGYIISNSGDSIYGMIDFKSDLSNCQHIYFKNDSILNVAEFYPNQLKAYQFINGKYYVSKAIWDNDRGKQVFLEVLIFGKVNVYYAVIEDKESADIKTSRKGYYFVEKDGELIEINNDQIGITDSYGNEFVRNSNQYKGILKAFFKDSPDLVKDVDRIEFNKRALINIAKDYHEKVCPEEECINFSKNLAGRKFSIGVEYIYALPKMNFYSLESKVISNRFPDRNYSFGILGATNLDFDYRFWFQVNLYYQYQSYSDSGMFRDVYPAGHRYEFTSILSDLYVKYNFLLTRLKPYFYAGVKVGYIIQEQYLFYSIINKVGSFAEDENMIFGFSTGSGFEYSITPKLNICISSDYNYYTTLSKMQISEFGFKIGFYLLI